MSTVIDNILKEEMNSELERSAVFDETEDDVLEAALEREDLKVKSTTSYNIFTAPLHEDAVDDFYTGHKENNNSLRYKHKRMGGFNND